MNIHRLVVLFVLSLFVVAQNYAANKPTQGKKENWINTITPDYTTKSFDNAESGMFYLLVDLQESVERRAQYVHYAYKILNSTGVQSMSDISVDYDPSYQKVVFHSATIRRNGEQIDLLKDHTFESYQHETDKERYLYDGQITNTLHLKDVRSGDIVEYEYTLIGSNPQTKARFTTSQMLSYTIPVKHYYYSVSTPTNRKLHLTYNKKECPQAEQKTMGQYEVYSWDLTNLNAVDFDFSVPSWYSVFDIVTLSEYNNWEEVVKWALPMYSVNNSELTRIKELYGSKIELTDPKSIMDAVRFVQDDIRYLGFEMGAGSYVPHKPEQVFKNRFGDCKDKSLLLVALLQSNGIEAYPVLVSTIKNIKLPEAQPCPEAFNHCIVVIKIRDANYFIDPTISYQGGSLYMYAFPLYHYGLVIRPDETGLTQIIPREKPATYCREEYYLYGENREAGLSVYTDYDGSKADYIRSYFAENSSTSINKAYLQYYENIYSDIVAEEDVRIDDEDRETDNGISIYEKYIINDGLWKNEDGKYEAQFYSTLINEKLHSSGKSSRETPYYIGEPEKIVHEIRVKLNRYYTPVSSEFTVDHPAFHYEFNIDFTDDELVLSYEYETFAEYVEAKDFASFYEKQEEVENHIAYTLSDDISASYSNNAGSNFAVLAVLLSMLVFLLSIGMGLLFVFMVNPEPKYSLEQYNGISGGLVFTAIIVCINPVIFFFDNITWLVTLVSIPDGMKPGIQLAYLSGFSLDVLLFVLSVFLIILFFSRRTSAPILYLILFIGGIISILISFIIDNGSPVHNEFYGAVLTLRILFSIICWVPFFIWTDQVRGTFTVQLKKKQPMYWHPPKQ